MRPIGRLAALAVIAAAGLTPPAAAAEPVTWGIVPSGPDGPGDRAAFEYSLDPGTALSDVVAVSNYTDAPLTLDLYASDAVRNTQGGFDLLPAADEPVDVGAWVDLGEPSVTVPARSRVDVPFRITVPDDATPGDHAGGIVAGLTSQASGGVTVDRRVGARIYLRVTGTLRPELAVDDVHLAFDGLALGQPGTVRVEYTVRNDGNVRLAGRPTVRVAGPFGLGGRDWTGDPLPELLPGDSVSGSASVRGVWQLGPMDVDVEIRAESSGSQALEPAPPPGTYAARLWVVPWIALTALAVVVSAVLLRRRRRRRRGAGAGPAGRAGEPGRTPPGTPR